MTERTVPARTTTRDDVARLAGVSSAVVSYVVNGGPRNVAPETAQRVTDAIRKLGYRPNANARALKTGSTAMLGLIVPDSRNPLWAELAHTVETEAAKKGYALVLANSAGELEIELRQIGILASHQLDGLLIASVSSRHGAPAPHLEGVPTVYLNQFRPSAGLTTIGPDGFQGSYDAVTHLVSHGHTDVGLIIGPEHDDTFRRNAWAQALRDADLTPGVVLEYPFTREGGYAAGRHWMGLDRRPTAIFAASDYQAIGLVRAMHEASVRVPEDLAIASFDGTSESDYTWPQLTVARQPLGQMASLAVAAVSGSETPPHHNSLPMELVQRASCGC